LLKRYSFEEMLFFYKKKYPLNDLKIVLEALAEIDLADDSEAPIYIVHKDWVTIKTGINNQWRLFQNEMINKKKNEADKRSKRIEALLKLKNKKD